MIWLILLSIWLLGWVLFGMYYWTSFGTEEKIHHRIIVLAGLWTWPLVMIFELIDFLDFYKNGH